MAPDRCPIDLGLRLRAEASAYPAKMTLTDPHAGPEAGARRLEIRQRRQTASWQFWFSDRFTGARNPACLPAAILSRRIRYAPLSSAIVPQFQPSDTFRPFQLRFRQWGEGRSPAGAACWVSP